MTLISRCSLVMRLTCSCPCRTRASIAALPRLRTGSWGLRDYGHDGQLGLEGSPAEYVEALTAVFAEVRRVLTDTGTLWLNLGDSYVSAPSGSLEGSRLDSGQTSHSRLPQVKDTNATRALDPAAQIRPYAVVGLPPKNLVGIPWRVAFALQADGWYLRSDIVWSKPNPMPESVTDRPTKSHEYVFLLSKSARYFYDAAAIAEPAAWERWGDQTVGPGSNPNGWIKPKTKQELVGASRPAGRGDTYSGFNERYKADSPQDRRTRNARSVWEIPTMGYPDAHFAVFPEELPRRCILAGCPEGGVVLDPFMGSGTTALVARKHGRRSVGIELNESYAALAAKRLGQQSLLAEGAV